MALTPGTRLGPYEIVALVGAGGMGEVYRARDTRLERTVALKVLPAVLAGDAHLRERFEREARAISSLQHPHICALYDVGREDQLDFLILEFLEGDTLAARLAAGPIAPPVALKIAIEICDALDRAHRSGIVHRDLKPANVMLTTAGAKLLDFGLAKSAAPAVATSGLSMLPTTPPNLTAQGTILGTFQYMAPEQIEGEEADARTDIFAFGALLFEMLTGRPAFAGKTRASLLSAILKDEPPRVSTLQPLAPHALDRIVSTCLAKDADDRYQAARDLHRDLQWVASGDPVEKPALVAPVQARPIGPIGWTIVGAVLVAMVAAGVAAVRLRSDRTVAEPMQFAILSPEKEQFGGPAAPGTGTASQVAVSPDGRNVVFVAGGQTTYRLWIRPLGVMTATAIPGTEQARFPFWSPDGRFVAFFADGKLKKISPTGGPPVTLCDAVFGAGGTWNRDNVIVFSPGTPNQGMYRVSAAGGTSTAVTTLDATTGETNHRFPYFLPDGRHFLYTATTGTCCPPPKAAIIRIGSLDSSEPALTLPMRVESAVAYASGHLLFANGDDTLMAMPFDADTRQPRGEAFPVAEHVSTEGSRYAGFSASPNGVLVYGRGSSQSTTRLTWIDRTGNSVATIGDPAAYVSLALSPDERRLAVGLGTGVPENRDIWIIDINRGVRSRLTFDPAPDLAPVWSPDGSRVAFGSQRSGRWSLLQRPVSGTSDEEILFQGESGFDVLTPSSWSRDGKYLAFTRGAGSRADVWVLPMFGDRQPYAILKTAFSETTAAFAPDGRWIAYSSDERGSRDVYVQPFPPTGDKHQVSQDGGSEPVWRDDGKELFFLRGGDARMMAAQVDTSHGFEVGAPQTLFPTNAARPNTSTGNYAVVRGGQRWLINSRRDQAAAAPLTVVVNWLAALQK